MAGNDSWCYVNPVPGLVAFSLDDQRYAVYISAVERVVPAVEITRLPQAPDIIAGIINIQGRILAVADIRKRFGLPRRELSDTDQFIISRTLNKSIAVIVDKVYGVIEFSADNQVRADTVIHGSNYIEGIVKLDDGMVLIHDLDKFLSLEERHELDQALDQLPTPSGGENGTPAP